MTNEFKVPRKADEILPFAQDDSGHAQVDIREGQGGYIPELLKTDETIFEPYKAEQSTSFWTYGIKREFMGIPFDIRVIGDFKRLAGMEKLLSCFRGRQTDLPLFDAGAGQGYMSFALAKAGFKTVGVELSQSMFEQSLVLSEKHNLKLSSEFYFGDLASIENIPQMANQMFAGANCEGVILHMTPEVLDKSLKNIADKLIRGAPFVVSMISESILKPLSPPRQKTSSVIYLSDLSELSKYDGYSSHLGQVQLFHSVLPKTEAMTPKVYIHSHELVYHLLAKNGFEITETTDNYVTQKQLNVSDRWRGGPSGYSIYHTVLAYKT